MPRQESQRKSNKTRHPKSRYCRLKIPQDLFSFIANQDRDRRMVNPGAFQGSRKEFLIGEKPSYKAGVDGGFAKDALAQIQQRYLKRYPISLPHEEEPMPEQLAAVDDDAADPEPELPDESKLSPEEYQKAMTELEDRSKLLKHCKGQIARWMQYQYMKEHDVDPTDPSSGNPYRVILHQLTGVLTHRPRLQSAAKIWRKSHRPEIEAEANKRALVAGVAKKRLAPIRERVCKELFSALPEEEKQSWKTIAQEEHQEALEKWDKELKAPIAVDPESRQRCIQNLTQFIKPILDIVCEATGWKATFMAGGPEPAHDGRLNMISVHSGKTSGDVKMTFGRSEQAKIKAHFIPTFSAFLRKCYTPEECQSRALSGDKAFERVADLELGNAEVHSIENASGRITEGNSNAYHTDDVHSVNPSEGGNSAPSAAASPPSTSFGLPSAPGQAIPPVQVDLCSPLASPLYTPIGSPCPSPSLMEQLLQRTPTPFDTTNLPQSNGAESLDVPQPEHRAPSPHISELPISSNPLSMPSVTPTTTQSSSISSATLPSTTSASSDLIPATSILKASSKSIPRKRGVEDVTTSNIEDSLGLTKRSLKRTRGNVAPASMNLVESTPAPSVASRTKKSSTSVKVSRGVRSLKAGSWFDEALSFLQTGNYGEEWANLLGLWSAFEKKEGYAQIKHLGAKGRPKVVGDWVKSGRPIPWNTVISNVNGYADEFTAWWANIQPEWRLDSKGQVMAKKVDGDWELLCLPGLNGLFSLLAGLWIWGWCLGDPTKCKRWNAAVKDCQVVLTHLCG